MNEFQIARVRFREMTKDQLLVQEQILKKENLEGVLGSPLYPVYVNHPTVQAMIYESQLATLELRRREVEEN